MIYAYHLVPPGKLVDVVQSDIVVTAIERVDPAFFQSDCKERIRTASVSRNTVASTAEALRKLVDQEISQLWDFQEREGVRARSWITGFHCWDLLAGDLENIFLSPFTWHTEPGGGATGLVFDARDLIRKGAGLREIDFGVYYTTAIHEILERRYTSVENAQQAILKALAGIREWELYEDEALDLLEKQEEISWGRRTVDMELIWPGPLPAHWAEEIWHEGRRVTADQLLATESK